jgi:molybdopterin-guanine dinucleotide biosynthesis protein A
VTSNVHNNGVAPIYGLVLAGGRSKRMGQDKSLMTWHGSEQRYYMADLLRGLCADVYLSIRADQHGEIDDTYKTIADVYDNAGPLAGILSAMSARPDVAWLVTACDLPLLDVPTLQYLIDHRDTAKMATTFYSPHDNLPEPLITIWEPAARELLLSFFG